MAKSKSDSNSNDESKGSGGLDRRAVLRGAIAVSGASMLAGVAAAKPTQTGVAAEREWARVLARQISSQLPEAIRQVPGVQLTPAQIEEIRKAFQNTLITNMGCEVTRR